MIGFYFLALFEKRFANFTKWDGTCCIWEEINALWWNLI